MAAESSAELTYPTPDERLAPQHGYQGEPATQGPATALPAGLSIAVSREAGARGGTIARRVARKLGWQVYNQELLEYIAQEGAFRDNLFANLPAAAAAWSEQELQRLLSENQCSRDPGVVNLARTILAVGTQGEVVMLGRGAGCVLPRASTLHVRIMAPLADRVAYMGQWLRLTTAEAAEQVRLRDQSRAQFIQTHFQRQVGDIYQYDLLLNSSLLGEDLCVELIAQAARAKQAGRTVERPHSE